MQPIDYVDPYFDCRPLIKCVEASSIKKLGSLAKFFEIERDLNRTPDQIVKSMLRVADEPECRNHPTSRIIKEHVNKPSFRLWLAAGLGLM